MTSEAILHDLPGGKALLSWFGYVPHFHDANLLEINLSSNRPSLLRVHAWAMTDKTDARGHFILDKHVTVTILLGEVTHVSLNDFNLPGIIGVMEITKIDDTYQVAWDIAYGVEGSIRAKQVRFELMPGKPDQGV
jgi:hypothetical protein